MSHGKVVWITGLAGAGKTALCVALQARLRSRLPQLVVLDGDECLMRSTVNGKLWWNAKNTIQVSGFDRAIVEQRFEHYLSRFDALRLRSLLRPYLRHWRYETPSGLRGLLLWLLGPLLILWPLTMERRAWASGRTFGPRNTPLVRLMVKLWAYVYARLRLARMWAQVLRNGRRTEIPAI